MTLFKCRRNVRRLERLRHVTGTQRRIEQSANERRQLGSALLQQLGRQRISATVLVRQRSPRRGQPA